MSVLSGSGSVDGRRLLGLAGRLRSALIDIAYPKTCAGCGSRGSWLCTWCEETVPILSNPKCDRCGAPELAGFSCWCGNMLPVWAKARSVYPYAGWAANAIKQLKYRDEFDRAGQLAPLMKEQLAEMGTFNALVPVPLHRSRFDERGYNQSEILADAISSLTGIPVHAMLKRTGATAPQASLSLEGRRKNVASAFSVDSKWAPRPSDRYLLIDDVRTSGATLNACAAVLVAAGSGPVCALTFALDLQGRELSAFLQRHP